MDDVLFAICLDSLGKTNENDDGLYMHVSRPPKEGQSAYQFLKAIESVANRTNTKFELIHKKINLASDLLAWEHERFSLNKISAFTLSHFNSYKDTDRSSITDNYDSINKNVLKRNIKIILQSLTQFMYRNENGIADHLLADDLVSLFVIFYYRIIIVI